MFLVFNGSVNTQRSLSYLVELGTAMITDVQDPLPTGEEDDTNFYAKIGLKYLTPMRTGGVSLSLYRSHTPIPAVQSGTGLNFDLTTTARLALHRKLGRAVRVNVFGETQISEREGIGFEPDEPSMVRFGGGLSWQMGRRVQSFANYSTLTRSSDIQADDYDRTLVNVGVNIGF